jgi:hypothetical protein
MEKMGVSCEVKSEILNFVDISFRFTKLVLLFPSIEAYKGLYPKLP